VNHHSQTIHSKSRPGVQLPGLAAFGVLVASRRSELGLSLRQLGDASGVNYTWLSRIEKGEIRALPGVEAFVGLARTLDTSVAELLICAGVEPSIVLPQNPQSLSSCGSGVTIVSASEVMS
jgi:transcriptional regulator with XRE-family HTH domain